MIFFLLIASIVFFVTNTYLYLLPYWRAEQNLQASKFQSAAQKAVVMPVIVEMFEDNEWDDDDRPTVVATSKNRSSLNL
jgi:hypothetical protein